MHQTNGKQENKNALQEESAEEFMGWGSPLNNDSESTSSSKIYAHSKQSTVLEFLDDESESSQNTVQSKVERFSETKEKKKGLFDSESEENNESEIQTKEERSTEDFSEIKQSNSNITNKIEESDIGEQKLNENKESESQIYVNNQIESDIEESERIDIQRSDKEHQKFDKIDWEDDDSMFSTEPSDTVLEVTNSDLEKSTEELEEEPVYANDQDLLEEQLSAKVYECDESSGNITECINASLQSEEHSPVKSNIFEESHSSGEEEAVKTILNKKIRETVERSEEGKSFCSDELSSSLDQTECDNKVSENIVDHDIINNNLDDIKTNDGSMQYIKNISDDLFNDSDSNTSSDLFDDSDGNKSSDLFEDKEDILFDNVIKKNLSEIKETELQKSDIDEIESQKSDIEETDLDIKESDIELIQKSDNKETELDIKETDNKETELNIKEGDNKEYESNSKENTEQEFVCNNKQIYESSKKSTEKHISNFLMNNKTTKFEHPLCFKHLGDVLLTCHRKKVKRSRNKQLFDSVLNTVELHNIRMPEINESSFKNKVLLETVHSSIKCIETDYAWIKAKLNLNDQVFFNEDIVIKIDQETLNSVCNTSELLINTPQVFMNTSNSLNTLQSAVLRMKLGLAYSFDNLNLSVHLFKQVALMKNKQLIDSFIKSQTDPVLFFVIFYKLGLVQYESYRNMFELNLYHQFVLSVLGLVDFSSKKARWNLNSFISLGISKILNVNRTTQQERKSPLDQMTAKTSRTEERASELQGTGNEKPIKTGDVKLPKDEEQQIKENRVVAPINTKEQTEKTPVKSSLFEDDSSDGLFGSEDEGHKKVAVSGEKDTVSSPVETAIYKGTDGARSMEALAEGATGYQQRFAKSFADIFSLGGSSAVADAPDLSSCIAEVTETDRPLLETPQRSEGGFLSFFRRNKPAPAKQENDNPLLNRATRPLHAELKVPERKERKVVHSAYANMKGAGNVDIPGCKTNKSA